MAMLQHRSVTAFPSRRRKFRIEQMGDGACRVWWHGAFYLRRRIVKYKINGQFATEFQDKQAAQEFIDHGWADKAVEDGWV